MRRVDIREYKQEIRTRGRALRAELDKEQRAALDFKIANNVRKLYQYGPCKTVMIYVSTPIEINTVLIIQMAFADGKRVAVPRCIPGTRKMEFYYITSLDDLEPGSFSVMEPKDDMPMLTDFDKCLMIMPGIQFDTNGYRIGYGKGYYDRYMAKYTGFSAGLCYDWELRRHLCHGRFDRPVSAVVTDSHIRTCKLPKPTIRKETYYNG